MVEKIKRIIPYQGVVNILYKLGLWNPSVDHKLIKSIYDFIYVNKKYWSSKNFNNDKIILIEGHLSNYGINYLFRTAVSGLAIQEVEKQNIYVLFPGFDFNWSYATKIYKSFGISRFIFIRKKLFLKGIFNNSKLFWLKTRLIEKINSPEDIINLKFDDIYVGDLIYDDILKKYNLYTISEVNANVFDSIFRAYKFYLDYKTIFKDCNVSYYVSTHTAYSEYGILCRVALYYNVKVIETTDIQTSIFKSISKNNLPTYHQGITNLITDYFSRNSVTQRQINQAKIDLLERMDAKVQQIDVQKAFKGIIYDRSTLINSLNLDPDSKIVFILAHIFSDSPHTSSGMIYKDYYTWLEETLNIASRCPNINWIIKPHPATELYNESGIIESLLLKFNNSNFRICPDNFNTKSIISCADIIITVHGTAGLEFACMGIPVILTGKPFYSNFGFTNGPISVSEYEELLLNINDIKRLDENQISKALEILYIWNTQFDWENPIITLDILNDIWGSERERDIDKAFQKITLNIQKISPKSLKMWDTTKHLISRN